MTRVTRFFPSERRQAQLSYLMQVTLIGLLFVGIDRADGGIVVNTVVALAVTQLPPILERDYEIPMDPRLTLWITSAVFLHALGTVGLPGFGFTFYNEIWWWDHLTHALSASLVAAVGYATVRAVDEHSDGVHIPTRALPVFIVSFVLAFGVLWEVLEFAIAIGADAVGVDAVLTQYGLEDTMLDLTFNAIGGLLVAIWGGAYLADVTGAIGNRLEGRSN